jgi:two-component system chemotaxis response regulator CheB
LTDKQIRLLIVDDSALMRKHLRLIFEQEGDFNIALARNGIEALEQAATFRPDVITLDVNMPGLDGLTCLERLGATDCQARVVMVSSLTEKGAEVTLRALELGAVDYVPKPDGTVSLSIERVRGMLVSKVRAAMRARPRRASGLRDRMQAQRRVSDERCAMGAPQGASPSGAGIGGLVLIGVSTGGPRTLEDILPQLPAHFPWPVVVAQHMPAAFTGVFARRLDGSCAIRVVEVGGVVPLLPGHAYIARGDSDVVVERRLGRLVANSVRSDASLWHPSVDRMVASTMKVMPPAATVGVLLTGMGNDGATEMTALRRLGGHTIAESEASAVIFGMPAELIRMGGAEIVLPADAVARQLLLWSR